MFNGPSIGAWEAVFGSQTKSLPSSADIWSSQFIVDAFPSEMRAGKAAGNFREGIFWKRACL